MPELEPDARSADVRSVDVRSVDSRHEVGDGKLGCTIGEHVVGNF